MKDYDQITEDALAYGSALEAENALLHAPARMKSEIIERSQKPDVQLIVRTQAAAKKLEFFIYSLRVGFAVSFALFMLIRVTQLPYTYDTSPATTSEFQISETLRSKSQQLSSYLNQTTNSIFKTEDLNHDTKTK